MNHLIDALVVSGLVSWIGAGWYVYTQSRGLLRRLAWAFYGHRRSRVP